MRRRWTEEYPRLRRLAATAALMLPVIALAATEDGRWHAGIGDPTFIGWFTVLVYAVAAVLCVRTTLAARRGGLPWRFWAGVSLAMILLGLNKQLDLQSWFTEVGRDLALSDGWYEDRRAVQVWFIAGLAMAAVLLLAGLRHALDDAWHHYRTTCVGLGMLCVFVLMRAASFHHVDTLLRMRWGAISANGLIENSALLVVAFGAWQAKQRQNG